MKELKRCPCGEIPEELIIIFYDDSDTWGHVYSECCAQWEVEFRNNGAAGDKSYELAVEAWNEAPRATDRIADLSEKLDQAIDLLDAGERAWLLAQWMQTNEGQNIYTQAF